MRWRAGGTGIDLHKGGKLPPCRVGLARDHLHLKVHDGADNFSKRRDDKNPGDIPGNASACTGDRELTDREGNIGRGKHGTGRATPERCVDDFDGLYRRVKMSRRPSSSPVGGAVSFLGELLTERARPTESRIS